MTSIWMVGHLIDSNATYYTIDYDDDYGINRAFS